MSMLVEAGAVDVKTYFHLRKISDNKAATGLTIGDIDVYYTRSGAAQVAKVDLTALAAATTDHTDSRGFETGNGVYRVDWVDAAFVYGAGVREVILTVVHADTYTEHIRVTIGLSGYNAILKTLVATTPSSTTFTPTKKPGDTNALLNSVAVFYDADGDPSFRNVTAWDGTTVTIEAAADFLVAVGDEVEFYPVSLTATEVQIAAAVWDKLRSAHTASGSFGEGVLAENLNSTAKTSIQTELTTSWDTAIPASPTPNSRDERLKALDDSLPAGALLDATGAASAVWDAVRSTYVTKGTFGEMGEVIVEGGTVETSGSNSTTQVQTDLAEATNDHYNNMYILFTSDTESGQARPISDYVGSTGVVSWVKALTATPPDSSTFVILAAPNLVDIESVAATVQTAGDLAALIVTADAIKKNTALPNFTFVMFASSDHSTPLQGLVITAERSLNAAAFAACANSASELSDGVYDIDLAAGDLNGDTVTLKFTGTGADPTIISIITQAA